jgi:hypothetical protein
VPNITIHDGIVVISSALPVPSELIARSGKLEDLPAGEVAEWLKAAVC